MNGSWSDTSWDDDESDSSEDESMLSALDYVNDGENPSSTSAVDAGADDPSLEMFFTVTNPPGTVSVTTLVNGLPMQIDLAPRVVDMTEIELTEEILLIARLAAQNALAGQHVLISGIMRRCGLDPSAVRSYLEHDLGLPSAEKVLAEKAQIFAARYGYGE